MKIRKTIPDDVTRLLELMRQLAEFEGYSEQFKVTEDQLRLRCFERKDFYVLVAEQNGSLVGMLVYYFLPFTYDLTPWMFIKELYVEKQFRGLSVGENLMREAAKICIDEGGSKMLWDVLSENQKAQSFYHSLGATKNMQWQKFQLSGAALDELV